jgi:23S rRNA (cytidine1920-2'-O)/16S rRNA (cytidine1409-2'-O)-methyltransferase
VRDPEAHRFAVTRVTECARETGGETEETIESPITGTEGNSEFLLHARWR